MKSLAAVSSVDGSRICATTTPLLKPRRTSLRASIDQLAQDLVRELFGTVRSTSFEELDELLRTPDSHRVLGAPATARPTATPSRDVLAGLTPQQRNVFERALHGSRNADIARDLRISLKTVQTHRAQVNKKLGVRSSSELVRFGAMHGLLNSPGETGLPPSRNTPPAPVPMFDLAQVERLTIGAAMSAAEGDRDRAAGLLGISRSALDAKLRPLKPAAAPPSQRAIPRVPTGVPRTKHRGYSAGAPSNGSVVRVESFPELAIVDPAVVLGTAEPAPDALQTLRASATRRAPSRTTRRPRNASIVAELTPPVLEPQAVPGPPVRAGEQLLRAAGGGVVLRRRPRSVSESPKLVEE